MAAYWFSPTEIINFTKKKNIKYFQLSVPVAAAERDLIAFGWIRENLISSFHVFFVLFSFRGNDGSILMIDIYSRFFFLGDGNRGERSEITVRRRTFERAGRWAQAAGYLDMVCDRGMSLFCGFVKCSIISIRMFGMLIMTDIGFVLDHF